MAIQTRRGNFTDFDPGKMLPGEVSCVLAGDPSVPSGKTFYVCYSAGDVKRMVSIEDIEEMEQAGRFKGEKGDPGDPGPKGADGNVTFESLTEEQKAYLKGEKGDPGEPGPKGDPGYSGVPAPTQEDNGKFLMVTDGEAAWIQMNHAEEASF